MADARLRKPRRALDVGDDQLRFGILDARGELTALPPAVEQRRAAARHQHAEVGDAPGIGVAHRDADAVAPLDAMPFDERRGDLARGGIDLFEAQSFVALDQKGRVAMLRTKKGDIVGQIRRRIGDDGQLAAKAFDGSDLDRPARTGDQIIGGFQAQIERRWHRVSLLLVSLALPLMGRPLLGKDSATICFFLQP